jgi:hypothetical protein
VQNGSTTVRQVWRGNISATNGLAYNAAEAVSWASGTGHGVYVADTGTYVEFYRTSGPNPVVGDVIDGDVTNAQRTIGSFPAENLILTAPVSAYPAAFATTGGTQGPIAANDDFFISGQPRGIVSATIGSDTFDLTVAWAGSTLTNVEAVVNRDRTSNQGWPIAKQNSRIPFAILEEFQRQLDEWSATIGGGGGGTPPTTFTNMTMSNNWANVGGRAVLAHAYDASSDAVILKGYINRSSGTATPGEDIVSAANGLPTGPPTRRPSERLDIWAGGEWVSIETDGSIKYRGLGGTPGPISLNGVTFRADSGS